MSVVQMTAVFRRSRSKGVSRLVLLALADVANDDGEVVAYGRSHTILAAKANCDPGSVGRAIDRLVELGEVEILNVGDGRRSTDYRLRLGEGAHPEGGQNADPGGAGRAPRVRETPTQGGQDALPITPSCSVSDRPPPSHAEATFEDFWAVYPRRVARAAAEKAWAKAVRSIDAETIVAGARRYAEERRGGETRFTAHPATWLNAGRWADDPAPVRSGPSGQVDGDREGHEGRLVL